MVDDTSEADNKTSSIFFVCSDFGRRYLNNVLWSQFLPWGGKNLRLYKYKTRLAFLQNNNPKQFFLTLLLYILLEFPTIDSKKERKR